MAREKAVDKRTDSVRFDGGKNTFDDRWGYESLASITENNAITSGGRFCTIIFNVFFIVIIMAAMAVV